MPTFLITRVGRRLHVGFGEPASGDAVVRDAAAAINALAAQGQLDGGGLIGVNGPCSLAAMAAIVHVLAHRFATVAIFDPKLDAYIVAISHEPSMPVGGLLTREQLEQPDIRTPEGRQA
ncbi:MAG: CRISPR-associated protein Csx3 [Propionibacteriaceae bacterium]|nr:CRISPR-associated protein Csx3 [Micropruina sp.]HBX81084.1 CRISPR-associated protein Csx3 [Propionibacteriaceae bacterium]HBY22664.1 CRISPR-associated protein Csx3 [Propionibacteriaceae bacterium]